MVSERLSRILGKLTHDLTSDERNALRNLIHNVKHVKGLRIGYEDGKVRVAEGEGSPRLLKIGKFLGKYWELLASTVSASSWVPPDQKSLDFLRGQVKEYGCYDKKDFAGLSQRIAEKWGEMRDDLYQHEIVTGQRIAQVYEDMYDTPGDSCMAGYKGRDAVQLFAKNACCKLMLIKTDPGDGFGPDDDWAGRALIWETDEGVAVLDRVYPSNNGPHTEYARGVAKREGWVYRVGDCHTDNRLSDDGDYSVTLTDVDGYPYMDTFKYVESDGPDYKGRFTAMTYSGWGTLEMESTDNTSPWGRCSCSNCGDRVHEEDASYECGNPYCEYCHGELFVYIYHESEYVRREDAYYSERYGEWMNPESSYVVWSEPADEYLYDDDAICITVGQYRGEYAHIDDVVTLYDGETAHESDATAEIERGRHRHEYALLEDTVISFSYERILKDEMVKIEAGTLSGDVAHENDVVKDYVGKMILEDEAVKIPCGPDRGKLIHKDEAQTHKAFRMAPGWDYDADGREFYVNPDPKQIDAFEEVVAEVVGEAS